MTLFFNFPCSTIHFNCFLVSHVFGIQCCQPPATTTVPHPLPSLHLFFPPFPSLPAIYRVLGFIPLKFIFCVGDGWILFLFFWLFVLRCCINFQRPLLLILFRLYWSYNVKTGFVMLWFLYWLAWGDDFSFLFYDISVLVKFYRGKILC